MMVLVSGFILFDFDGAERCVYFYCGAVPWWDEAEARTLSAVIPVVPGSADLLPV
jgi:hypothetical protein